VADGNDENMFLQLLGQHLSPGSDHPDYLALASEPLGESRLANVRFLRAELAGPGDTRPLATQVDRARV
jgi:hypothetical protein